MMKDIPKIHEGEYRFCVIMWEHEPIRSAQLAQLCKEQLGWSRTTTYTVIRRLTDRGVVQSENTIVSSVVKKEEVQLSEMNALVEKTFEGSLPAFLAAFAKRQKLSEEDREALRRLIEQGGK